MIKSVNDTNVWIAGINWDRGAGYQIRLHWEAGRFQHFISAEILYEIIRVLREVFGYPDERLYDWYWVLLAGSVFVVPGVVINVIQEDPDIQDRPCHRLRRLSYLLRSSSTSCRGVG